MGVTDGGSRVFTLAKRRRNGEEAYELRSKSDPELRETLEALKDSKDDFEELNDVLKKALDIHPDKKRNFLARILRFVLPEAAYSHLPMSVIRLMAEESDVLELIERLMRTNIDGTQNALRSLAQIAIRKQTELEELESDIEHARDEDWDAQRLQKHMSEKAGIDIYQEVSTLLDSEFRGLSLEEKEARKVALLEHLRSNAEIGNELMKLISRVGSAGLQIFHRAMAHYYAYVNFYGPIAVIRDSAQTMTDMNESMYASKDALIITMQKSLAAIEVAVDASSMVSRYAIASPDMKKQLEAGRTNLERQLLELKESEVRGMLTSGEGAGYPIYMPEVVAEAGGSPTRGGMENLN